MKKPKNKTSGKGVKQQKEKDYRTDDKESQKQGAEGRSRTEKEGPGVRVSTTNPPPRLSSVFEDTDQGISASALARRRKREPGKIYVRVDWNLRGQGVRKRRWDRQRSMQPGLKGARAV